MRNSSAFFSPIITVVDTMTTSAVQTTTNQLSTQFSEGQSTSTQSVTYETRNISLEQSTSSSSLTSTTVSNQSNLLEKEMKTSNVFCLSLLCTCYNFVFECNIVINTIRISTKWRYFHRFSTPTQLRTIIVHDQSMEDLQLHCQLFTSSSNQSTHNIQWTVHSSKIALLWHVPIEIICFHACCTSFNFIRFRLHENHIIKYYGKSYSIWHINDFTWISTRSSAWSWNIFCRSWHCYVQCQCKLYPISLSIFCISHVLELELWVLLSYLWSLWFPKPWWIILDYWWSNHWSTKSIVFIKSNSITIWWSKWFNKIFFIDSGQFTQTESNLSIYCSYEKSLQSIGSRQWFSSCTSRRNSITLSRCGVSDFFPPELCPTVNGLKFSCVISTLCTSNEAYQRINPKTQVAVFSVCTGTCPPIVNIVWNIYHGEMNLSSNMVQWILFNQTNQYRDIWFYGNSLLMCFVLGFTAFL